MMPSQFLKQERVTLPHTLTLHPKADILNVEVYCVCLSYTWRLWQENDQMRRLQKMKMK